MPAEVDPELAARLAREAQAIYSAATAELLQKVAQRLAAGIDSPAWAEMKLADVVRLRNETTAILAALEAEAAATVTAALTEAYGAGQTAELGAAFTTTSGRALRELIAETVTSVTNTHSAILRTTLDRYRAIIAESTARVSIGIDTRRGATQKALDAFAKAGITGFRDSAGRRWEIETYAEMAVRTASGRAAVAGSLERIESRGLDYVIVSNAPEECSTCRPWEGKVLSISGTGVGKQDGFTCTASVATAREAGLLHSNCRHNLSAYVPGLTKAPTTTADPEGDKERQRQRALERSVREAKRRAVASKTYMDGLKAEGGTPDPATIQQHKRIMARQKAATENLSSFIEETGRKRLRYREQIKSAR